MEGKKLTLALEVPSYLKTVCLFRRAIFVLEEALYDCSSYGSLVDKSVVGFLRPIQFQSTRLRFCPLKAYQDKCHQGKHTAATAVNLEVTASSAHLSFSNSLLISLAHSCKLLHLLPNIRQNHDLSFVLSHSLALTIFVICFCRVSTSELSLPFYAVKAPSPTSTPSFPPSRQDDE